MLTGKCEISVDLHIVSFILNSFCRFTLVLFLCIIAEFNDRQHARHDNRRRSDRSREHSRERYYDPYDSRYSDYYRAAYAPGLVFFHLFLMLVVRA